MEFRQYILKLNRSVIKLYKLCDSKLYLYIMTVYLSKQNANTAENVTPTHEAVIQITRIVEGVEHKPFMDNYIPSPCSFLMYIAEN